MAEESAEIPILGLDTRPLQRQSTPGLCSDIQNLRPDGPKGDPYWKAIPEPGDLENSSGVAFSHSKQGLIVNAYWQLRSVIGSQATDPEGSLQRLIVVFSDGSIEIIDPEKGSGWETVDTRQLDGDSSDQWEVDFARIGEVTAIAITKNEEPIDLLYLLDDTYLDTEFPRLPEVYVHGESTIISQDNYDTGNYRGVHSGYYAVRYGFKLTSGKAVLMTDPIILHLALEVVEGPVEYNTTVWGLWFKLVRSFDLDVDSWGSVFSGIGIYLSEKKDDPIGLMNATYYEIGTFDHLKPEDEGSLVWNTTDLDDTHKDEFYWAEKEENLINQPVAEIQDFGQNKTVARTIFSYNNRLVAGDIKEIRSQSRTPKFNIVQRVENVLYRVRNLETRFEITFFAANGVYFYSDSFSVDEDYSTITDYQWVGSREDMVLVIYETQTPGSFLVRIEGETRDTVDPDVPFERPSVGQPISLTINY